MSTLLEILGMPQLHNGFVMLDLRGNGAELWKEVPKELWYDGRYEWEDEDEDETDPQKWGAETEPHITLKYGLIVPAYQIKPEIYHALGTWKGIGTMKVANCGVLQTGPDYDLVVAYLANHSDSISVEALYDANRRLSTIPHVDTFSTYTPHMTIGYVKKGLGNFVSKALDALVKEEDYLITLDKINFGKEIITDAPFD